MLRLRNQYLHLMCLILISYGGVAEVTLDTCAAKADLVLLLDVSGSIRDDTAQTWISFLNFIDSFVNCLPIGHDRIDIAAVQFSSVATLEFDFDVLASSLETRQAIDMKTFPPVGDGRTNLADGISLVLDTFKKSRSRPDAQKVVVAVTDGQHNVKSNETSERISELHEIAHVISIGITNSQNVEQLERLATSNTDVFHSMSYQSLTGAANRLQGVICESQMTERMILNEGCELDFDITIVLAGCGDSSCPESRMSQLFLTQTLAELLLQNHQNKLSLVTSNGIAFVLGYFTNPNSVADFLQMLDDFPSEPDLLRTMDYVLQSLESSNKPREKRVVYFLTDGCSDNKDTDILTAAKHLSSLAQVIPIGITDIANTKVLKLLASCPECIVEKMDLTTGPHLLQGLYEFSCPQMTTPIDVKDSELNLTSTPATHTNKDKIFIYFLLLVIAILVLVIGSILFCVVLCCPHRLVPAGWLKSKEKFKGEEKEDMNFSYELDMDINTISEKKPLDSSELALSSISLFDKA